MSPPALETQLLRARELADSLDTIMPGAAAPLEQVAGELPRLLEAGCSLAYTLKRDDDGLINFDQMYQRGLPPRLLEDGLRIARAQPLGAFLFDPFLPEVWQRDRALSYADLGDPDRAAIHRLVLRPHGMGGNDLLRALVCEGPTLLAWVGVYRAEPFAAGEKRVLSRLLPALQRRLKLDRLLSTTALRLSALEAALEAIPSAAFVVSGLLHVEQANAAGRALLAVDRMAVLEALRQSLSAQRAHPAYSLTRLSAPGMPDHYLAIASAAPADPEPRLALASERWRLSPKQSRVLSLLSLGHSNRALAALLRCAEGTIEQHIKALFEKSGTGSRAELVAAFWTRLEP